MLEEVLDSAIAAMRKCALQVSSRFTENIGIIAVEEKKMLLRFF